MNAQFCAIILAAGKGRRMGQDKALLELGGKTAVQRVADHCAAAGLDVLVVRRIGATALPANLRGIEVEEPHEMIDSLRAGVRALPEASAGCLIFPVDYAMVAPETVVVVRDTLDVQGTEDPGAAAIAVPLFEGRPGHPIGVSAKLAVEILDPEIASLRQVIRRDRSRVRAVEVADPWILRDLDRPEDLQAARAALASQEP